MRAQFSARFDFYKHPKNYYSYEVVPCTVSGQYSPQLKAGLVGQACRQTEVLFSSPKTGTKPFFYTALGNKAFTWAYSIKSLDLSSESVKLSFYTYNGLLSTSPILADKGADSI